MIPGTISGINMLPYEQKREIYRKIIPPELIARFNLSPTLFDDNGHDLLCIEGEPGSSNTEMGLFHRHGFPDPVLYGHITDTFTGKFHILLYVLNDPHSPRYDVDRMPDGTLTHLGTTSRNIPAELEAMRAGYSPGQVHLGLGFLKPAVKAFEEFVIQCGQDLYFAEPLHYHNAILFERSGFAYEKGRRLMERIQKGFEPGGDLREKLDGSTPFRVPGAADSILGRSWAIHDGILGEPFTNVTVYKRIGHNANISTCSGCTW